MLPRLVGAVLALAPALAAGDEYALVVHPRSAVEGVSFRELTSIFKAEKQSWSRRERIYLILPKSGTQEHGFLLDHVYRMTEEQLARYWIEMQYRNRISARPKALARGRLTISVVRRKSSSVALVRVADLPPEGAVKVLRVDGLRPGEQGYPLAEARTAPAEARPEVALASASRPAGDGAERIAELESTVDDLLGLVLDDEGVQPGASGRPTLEIHGFGHVEVGAEGAGGASSNQFALGGLDLFIQSQLTDRLSFLSETLFEPTTAGDYVLDVERLILKYDFGDALRLSAGRFHTTIGHWNEAFHHGEWLQTTIGRPRVFDFEDEDGLLPVHLVGLVARGRRPVGGGSLDYTLEVGNGRGPTPGAPQLIEDANESKAVNVAAGFAPDAVDGLRVGGSLYVDDIPAAPGVHGGMDERIATGFATWQTRDWELIGEVVRIDHRERGGPDTGSTGLYVQVARRFCELTPYARFETLAVDDADRFFTSTDDLDRYTVGVRWDFADWSAVKVQYDHSEVDASAGGRTSVDGLRAQVSFAF